MKNFFNSLLISFSYLTLIRNPVFGLIILAFIFTNPASGIFSLAAFISALLFGRFIGLSRENMVNGLFTYNSILTGLLIGYLFQLSFLSIVLTAIISSFTVLVSFVQYSVVYLRFGVPILNLPFTVSATLLYLASIRYGNLSVARNMTLSFLNISGLPLWLTGLFKATGIFVFLPYDVIGLCILASMLLFSRINFFLMIAGYYAGASLLGLLKGSFSAAFSDIYTFNFILIALALGGFFLIPSFRSYCIACVGVIMSVFILDAVGIFWSHYNVPVFTFPFVAIVSLVLFVLNASGFPYMNASFLKTPEQDLEHFLNYTGRFNIRTPQPMPPFSGEWTVYQGFDDQWTHKGIWKHALDFVIVNGTEGKTYRNGGTSVTDYYCFMAPVLSPVTGTVVACHDTTSDNPIGTVDKINNWGNYIVIRSLWDYYVQISHLAERSISVKCGEQVSVGQPVARCGNSGYSPQPHIHLQCSWFPGVSAPSIAFFLSNYCVNGRAVFSNERVKRGQAITPLVPSRVVQHKLQFMLDDSFVFDIFRNGTADGVLTVTVKMDPVGNYFMTVPGETTRLYFSVCDAVFSFFKYEGDALSPLKHLFLALPRVPLTEPGVAWEDSINPTLVPGAAVAGTFLKSFNHTLFKTTGSYTFESADCITGSVAVATPLGKRIVTTRCELAHEGGFKYIGVASQGKRYELVRQNG
jgi:urea transporter